MKKLYVVPGASRKSKASKECHDETVSVMSSEQRQTWIEGFFQGKFVCGRFIPLELLQEKRKAIQTNIKKGIVYSQAELQRITQLIIAW